MSNEKWWKSVIHIGDDDSTVVQYVSLLEGGATTRRSNDEAPLRLTITDAGDIISGFVDMSLNVVGMSID